MAPWDENDTEKAAGSDSNVSVTTVAYISILCTMLIMAFVIMCLKMSFLGQKTRSPQQRRLYVGSRARPSLSQQEPTIFVSPSNFPPPPKYECMAPPSYEEVVGVHYPNYQIPITQPITTALAQSSASNAQNDNTQTTSSRNETATVPESVITVSCETGRNSDSAVRS